MNGDTSVPISSWHRRAIRLVDALMARLPGRAPRVVLLGFWRSGTTVALEQVAAHTGFRSFFEPLHFSVPQARAMHPDLVFDVGGRDLTQWIPFQHPSEPSDDLHSLIGGALAGSLSTRWTHRKRRLGGSFSRGTVVKFVRANLLGAWIQRTFDVRPIWIVRHPGAVLASIMRPSGGTPALRASLGDPRLLRWVVEQDGVRRHWPELTDLARTWDDSADVEENILRLWAVTHWIPWRLAEEGEWSPLLLPFRRMVSDTDALPALLREQGLARRDVARVTRVRDSSTTKKERRGISAQARIHGWREELGSQIQDSLERLIGSFGPGFGAWIDSLASRREEPC